MKPKVFVAQPIPEVALDVLRQAADVSVYPYMDRQISVDELVARRQAVRLAVRPARDQRDRRGHLRQSEPERDRRHGVSHSAHRHGGRERAQASGHPGRPEGDLPGRGADHRRSDHGDAARPRLPAGGSRSLHALRQVSPGADPGPDGHRLPGQDRRPDRHGQARRVLAPRHPRLRHARASIPSGPGCRPSASRSWASNGRPTSTT